MDMALRATLFSAVGTCGQRCTTLRRLYLHEDVYDQFIEKLVVAYETIAIGNPLDPETLCGPLHNQVAVDNYLGGIQAIKACASAKILTGGVLHEPNSNFVKPTLVAIDPDEEMVQHEIFAPITYVMKFKDLDEAIALNNNVPQGLSSSLFTNNQSSIFKWTGPSGSDCGIVNVNVRVLKSKIYTRFF